MVGGGTGLFVSACARELALFAGAGFLIGGGDDLLIDLLWCVRLLWRAATAHRRPSTVVANLPVPDRRGPIAIFVPAWAEEAVIGAMVATALARVRHPDWRLYVGCYPNDPGTIAAVRRAAGDDPRVRLVVGDAPGPTTKAACLNWLWSAMRKDEDSAGQRVKAVVLHDAEDAVHADELAVYDALIGRFDLVQLPVLPVVVGDQGWPGALVSGHYCGEFAEAHAKQLVVREAMGAAMPSAGVGCAIARDALERAGGGEGPFDPDSLTEDYELGLRLGQAGGRGTLARVDGADGGLVAVHACFPHTLAGAIRQKGRWTAGIALAGWDRLGWAGGGAERWMRLRDRRALLAAIVLVTGYAAMLLWALLAIENGFKGRAAPSLLPFWLIRVNVGLLAWRTLVRAGFTGHAYGWRMALLTPVHMLIGNVVAVVAAFRALGLYWMMVRRGQVRWDKTAHVFPAGFAGTAP